MPYQRNKNNVAVKPLVDSKKIDQRRDEALQLYQTKARELTEQIRELEGRKNGLETTLKSSYTEHQKKVDALYDELKKKQSEFTAGCHTQDSAILEKQRRVDIQQANLETERITISDSKLDLIDKENRLIEFGNDLNAQQQIIDNDKDYVQSMEESNRVARVELDLLKDEANESLKRCQERKQQILKMEADLNARIKEHDVRLDEIAREDEKLKKVIEEYKDAHAGLIISQAERRDFDAEVEKNNKYTAQLKETGENLRDQDLKLAVKTKAARIVDRDLRQRMEQVKILERNYTKGGSHG